MSLFPPPKDLPTEVYVDVVQALGLTPREVPYSQETAPRPPTHSFLEGPSFDRDGNLYVVNCPFGQVFRIRPNKDVEVVTTYKGIPNGLKIHRDGDIYIADRMNGIVRLDPVNGRTEVVLGTDKLPGYKGVNDLVFQSNGDLYFTDQGATGLHNPTGRVFRWRTDGQVDLLLDNVPSPNGIVLNPAETHLFIAVTFGPQVWRGGILPDGSLERVGVFQQFSGGYSGPDGLAMDTEAGLAVCHNRLGTVWMFNGLGEPTWRLRSCKGLQTTNLAYGGPDNRTLFITESESGCVLRADVPVAGQPMYSHQ